MLMNSRKERLRLWRFDGLPAVRVRAAEQVAEQRPHWITFHVSTSEFRTAVRPDVLEEFGAISEMQRQQQIGIMGSTALARAWRAPGVAFGELVLPDVTFWVHPLETLPEGISGVLGLDVLERVGAIINLRENWLTVHPEEPEPA